MQQLAHPSNIHATNKKQTATQKQYKNTKTVTHMCTLLYTTSRETHTATHRQRQEDSASENMTERGHMTPQREGKAVRGIRGEG